MHKRSIISELIVILGAIGSSLIVFVFFLIAIRSCDAVSTRSVSAQCVGNT